MPLVLVYITAFMILSLSTTNAESAETIGGGLELTKLETTKDSYLRDEPVGVVCHLVNRSNAEVRYQPNGPIQVLVGQAEGPMTRYSLFQFHGKDVDGVFFPSIDIAPGQFVDRMFWLCTGRAEGESDFKGILSSSGVWRIGLVGAEDNTVSIVVRNPESVIEEEARSLFAGVGQELFLSPISPRVERQDLDRLATLLRKHPASQYAPFALLGYCRTLWAMRARQEMDEVPRTLVNEIESVLDRHVNHTLAPDMTYWLVKCSLLFGDKEKAKHHATTLLTKYMASEATRRAKDELWIHRPEIFHDSDDVRNANSPRDVASTKTTNVERLPVAARPVFDQLLSAVSRGDEKALASTLSDDFLGDAGVKDAQIVKWSASTTRNSVRSIELEVISAKNESRVVYESREKGSREWLGQMLVVTGNLEVVSVKRDGREKRELINEITFVARDEEGHLRIMSISSQVSKDGKALQDAATQLYGELRARTAEVIVGDSRRSIASILAEALAKQTPQGIKWSFKPYAMTIVREDATQGVTIVGRAILGAEASVTLDVQLSFKWLNGQLSLASVNLVDESPGR